MPLARISEKEATGSASACIARGNPFADLRATQPIGLIEPTEEKTLSRTMRQSTRGDGGRRWRNTMLEASLWDALLLVPRVIGVRGARTDDETSRA